MRFVWMTMVFCLIMSVADLQAQTYEVRGRVVDALTDEPLPGATVHDKANYNGTATDINGNFRLPNLPQGTITLTFSYLGYESHEETIVMPGAAGTALEIRLSSSDVMLTEVLVTGSFDGQQRALNQQRSADNIMNIVSSDLIGQFPDKNVAEALQRLPGINIARDKGEGSTVSIRGTPLHFTNISINGEQMASVQQSGARTEALDLISADQLASIEVTKALTPDMDGDAIGGNINLRTPTARSLDFQLRGDVGVGFSNLSGRQNYIGKTTMSQRFFPNQSNTQGRLGALLSGSYYANNNSEDRMDATWSGIPRPVQMLNDALIMPDNFQYRKTENKRDRIGLTATFDYKVKNHEVIFNYMYNYREDDDLRNRLRFDFNRSGTEWITLDSVHNARIRRDINLWNEIKTNHNYKLEGVHTLGSWIVDWGAFYTISNRDYTSTRGDFSRDEINVVADNTGGILQQVPQFRPSHPHDLKNPLLMNDFRRYEEDLEYTNAANTVGRLNVKKDYLLNGNSSTLQFGTKVRRLTNEKFRDNKVFAFYDPNNLLNKEESFAHVSTRTEPLDFLDARYNYGPRVDKDKFRTYMDTHRRLLIQGDDSWDAERLSKSDTYDATEDVYAAYIMNRLRWRDFLIITGVRYEYNNVKYDAFDVKRSGTNVVATPIQGGSKYGFLLPNAHVRYSVSELSSIRFAYTHSYAKPNFVDLVPFVNYDADAARLYLGNTELMPSLSNNIDLMYERYDRSGGILSGGIFFKNMNSFQFTRIVPSLIEDFPGYPQTVGFEFRQEQNGEKAIVYGLEINYMQQLTYLPGVLDGLSAYFNYTFTGSEANTQDRFNMRLPGQAMHTGNGALSWDYRDFTSKFSVNYNGSFINSVASTEHDDIIQAERWQMDLNLSLRLNRNFSIYAEFMNLTNAPSIRYQGNSDQIARIAYFGWSGRFGITYRL